jgi:hypothetical protein
MDVGLRLQDDRMRSIVSEAAGIPGGILSLGRLHDEMEAAELLASLVPDAG